VRGVFITAAVSALLLAALVFLRPFSAYLSGPPAPDTKGHASRPLPQAVRGAPATLSRVAPIEALGQVEQRIFDRTNEQRRRQGLRPLDHDGNLSAVARRHSEDMLRRGFFDHVNPDNESPADRVALTCRQLIGSSGENIWMRSGYAASQLSSLAEEALASLMSSPAHRENIFRPAFTHLGVGVAAMASEVRLTQVFADIEGLTDSPVPVFVKRGELLRFAVRTLTPGVTCDTFDVWRSRTGLRVLGPLPTSGGRIDVPPGLYTLRFYFWSADGRIAIYPGPQIEVR